MIHAESRALRCGFTLIELLITMAVIIIVSGFVMTAVGGNDGTNELNSAISRADSVFSLARSAAISRKTPVRVLVCNDASQRDATGRGGHYLRFLTVYYFDAQENEWRPFMEGEFLPSGIFVDIDNLGNPVRSWNAPSSLILGTGHNSIPQPITESFDTISGVGGNWIVYEFHANGTAQDPMARFVLGRAVQSAVPLNVVPNEFMRAGFVLFRSGKVVHFQSPEHLQGAL